MRISLRRAERWNTLGTYNSEIARGIVHTPEWDAEMAEEQRLFNEEQHRFNAANGIVEI